MARVLWVSQHRMNPVQSAVLRRMFGADVQVDEDPRPFDRAETIVQRVREGGYDDCIVVAPYSVLARMVDQGLRPLWAEAEVTSPEQADWVTKGRHYRFVRFKRVKRLVLELEDLGPDAERQPTD